MLGAVSLILVVTLSIPVTRVAAIALIHTGVTRELARFQARSAFTGAGFTMSDWVDRRLSRLVNRLLSRYTELNVRDCAGMMNLTGDYTLVDLRVRREDWLNGKTLDERRKGASGEASHDEGVAEQDEVVEKEKREDPES